MACTALITQSTDTAILEEWAKLDLSAPNSRVLRLTRVQFDDNSRPLGVEEVVLALERFPGLAANGGDVPDLIELAQRHGISLGRATERISIVQATKDVASRLRVGCRYRRTEPHCRDCGRRASRVARDVQEDMNTAVLISSAAASKRELHHHGSPMLFAPTPRA